MKMNNFLKKIAFIDIIIFAAVTLLYKLKDWTIRSYVDALTIAGFALVCIGILSILGEWGSTRSFGYQYASSVGKEGISERTKFLIKDISETYSFFILMSAGGVIAIILAILIDVFFS